MKITVSILCAMLAGQAMAADKMNSLQNIPLNDINDQPTSLKAYAGKVVLLVNVASKCGFTKQYTGLEAIYKKYKDKGLVVIGVPSNDFGSQEPGTAGEIKAFCTSKFDVTFPLMAKIHVKGVEQHPLYAALTGPDSAFPGEVKWNFQKFIIGRDGRLLGRFESKVTPESTELTQAIEAALARK
jgi:glutathione peroxidase